MPCKVRLILFCVFFVSELVYSDELYPVEWSEPLNKRNIYAKQQLLDSASLYPLVDWNRDGLYLWILQNSSQRLFIFDEGQNAKIIQYPVVKYSQWVHPQEYLSELLGKMRTFDKKKCAARLKLDDWLYGEIKRISFDEIFDVYDTYALTSVGKTVYLGFYKSGETRKYIYFHDIRKPDMVFKRPLDVLLPIYKMLDSYPFDVKLRDCK